MKQAQEVTTRFPIASDLRTDNVKRLSDLINVVYDDAESGMWKRNGTRTNPAEVERLLRARAMIVAEIDGVLVGSVNVNLFGDGVGELGMLVADRQYRGLGIGSALIEHAENWARQQACHNAPRDTHAAPLDASEQGFSAAVVYEDWVCAANYRTVRIDAP
jgi:GNAT superfamily N-acetyltransferase